MATPTSSSNRSKRKTNKPVTQGQNPQRSNRQKVSNAQVTNNSTRGSNAGSAKVTTGRGASKPAPKALPPSQKGGPLATQGRGSLKGQPQLPPGRKGGPVEKAGPTIDVNANTQKLPKGNKPTSTPKPSLPKGTRGGALARNPRPTVKANAPRGAGLTAFAATLGAPIAAAAGSAIANAYGKAITKERTDQWRSDGGQGRYVPGNQQVTPPSPKPTAKPKPTEAAKPATRSQSTISPQSRNTSSTSVSRGSSQPSTPKPAAPKERRVSAATANRESGNYGTSRTNNPLMADLKEAMKRREEKQAGTQGSSSTSDRSKYVAPNGQQYAGPAFGNGTSANSKPVESALKQKSGSEKLADAVKKQQDDEKQRRDNLVTRRPGTSKPGSTY